MKSKKFRANLITYAIVIAAFIACQVLISTGVMTRSLKGQLVPICAYIVMAISLNLTVGISGELSLGHAGFMSVGAFSGIVMSMWLSKGMGLDNKTVVLLAAIITGGVAAGIAGVLIGIPVLRLRGDYLAIVTLAFGEIIRNVMNCDVYKRQGCRQRSVPASNFALPQERPPSCSIHHLHIVAPIGATATLVFQT